MGTQHASSGCGTNKRTLKATALINRVKGVKSFQELLISVSDHELGNLDHSSQGKLEKAYKRVNLWANLSEHRLQKTIRVLSYGGSGYM